MSTFGLTALALALALATATAGARAQGAQPSANDEHRGVTLESLAKARVAQLADPGDREARLTYGGLCYEVGRFDDAFNVVEPLLGEEAGSDALLLGARAAYLKADYDTAEELLLRVLRLEPDNVSVARKLALVYYQTKQYARCSELPAELLAGKFPHFDLMISFQDEPYRAVWDDDDETVVPFLITDPLPLITVEVNGHELTALIDTGGDSFILDPVVAKELGIEVVASMTGMFAGGMEADVGLAKASTLRLGGVTLHSVPLALLPTGGMELGGYGFSGIVGTGVLKQFLATMDYPNGRLILRAPSGAAASRFYEESAGKVLDEVPFYLQSTHFLMAPGSLDGVDGLLFHVDSGLAGEAAFSAPRPTLEYVGIPIPETTMKEGFVGGGGGGFPTATFDVAELGLGDLRQNGLVGSYGSLPPQSYRMMGFIEDGLISHNFLKRYAWTLDFDRMVMLFSSA